MADPVEKQSITASPLDSRNGRSGRKRTSTEVRRIVTLAVGGGVLLILVLVSAVGDLPRSAIEPNPSAVLKPPSSEFWFGTDSSGRDVFARTIRSAHLDLFIGVGGAVVGMVIGSALGIASSSRSRWAGLFMRGVDAAQSFPLLVIVLVIVSITEGGIPVVIGAVALVNIPRFIRIVRSKALVVRSSDYVAYSEVIGVSRTGIMADHMLRNVTGIMLTQLSLGAASAVSVIAAISFLGAGVPPPTPTWGSMLQVGASGISTGAWWPIFFPSLFLIASIVIFNVMADALSSLLERN